MVQQAMQYIDETPDIETKIELIKTLNSVSAGKVNTLLWILKCSILRYLCCEDCTYICSFSQLAFLCVRSMLR